MRQPDLERVVTAAWTHASTVRPERFFQRELEFRAQMLAQQGGDITPLLADRLGAKRARPVAVAFALATLGRIGGEAAASVCRPWLERESKTTAAAAFHALAMMGEDARTTIEPLAASRRKRPRERARRLLSLLDAPGLEPLRRLRQARDMLNLRAVDRLLVRDPHEVFYGVQNAESDAVKAELLQLGAPALARIIRCTLEAEKFRTIDYLSGYFHTLKDTESAPMAVALVCVEHHLPTFDMCNLLDRQNLLHFGERVFGERMRDTEEVIACLPEVRARADR